MVTQRRISTPQIIIDNQVIGIVPNSFSYTEGFGEQTYNVQSGGGNSVQTVLGQNVETAMSDVKFRVYNTLDNIELLRSYKAANILGRTQVITASDQASGMTRTFQGGILTNNYEVALGADSEIDIEFKTLPAV